ncbi:MBL fold metallo-hydrolase [Kribbella turkmenica]|uniref:MBL fold metallo-hydrolase n=1 Tax=Kribbella turkmenica TaxID=2530375 RepID=A0A4R4XBE3_9ACTN|nr:MBL fold metallo-hydrolase [Kribbella turkmenica]TDD27910.1 MBL fold metallo-hydrolase [Kribbella turkmenica]
MKIGSVHVVPVLDGVARLPIELAVASQQGSPWDCGHQPLDARGRIRMDIGSFLVRIKDRTILVDLGVGPRSIHEAFVTGGLMVNLNRISVEPEDVTDVVFTHLHIDHVGWSTVQGKATFPRATYRVHAADWAHFMTGAPVDPVLDSLVREVIAPIEGQLETFDAETELLPGLYARPAPGHTPGSTIFVVADAGERALLLGDVAHTVAELTDPVWEGVADVDKSAANAVRQRIADELEASGDAFAPAHFPELAFGRLVTVDGVRKFAWA